jgi:hypothetical protein
MKVNEKFVNFGTGTGQVNSRTIPANFTSSNYTPTQVGSEGTDKVSSHLKGIDTKFSTILSNPMDASGDIIYGGTSGIPTKLVKSTDGKVLTLISGLPSWQTPTATSSDTLSDVVGRGASTTTSVLFQNATAIELGKDDSTNVAGKIKLWGAGANNYYTTIVAGEQTANVAYILPIDQGGNGYFLVVNSSGQLSWQNPNILGKHYTLTVTGTNWTTEVATGIGYQTDDGVYRLRFNISGSLSSGSATPNISITGITSRATMYQVCAVGSDYGTDYGTAQLGPNGNTIGIRIQTSRTYFTVSGDVELASKPSFM